MSFARASTRDPSRLRGRPGPAGRSCCAGAVLPQVLPEVVAFWLYRFEINLRASAILGLVGAGGVGAVLARTLQYRRSALAGMTVIVVVVATVVIDALSAAARRRIIRGSDRPIETAAAGVTG